MISRITRCLALAASIALISGCSSVPKDEYEAALDENAELREKLASSQTLLEQSETDKDQLYRENQDLNADLTRSRNQAPSGQGGSSGSTFGATQGAAQQGAIQPTPMGVSLVASDVVLTVAGDVLFDSGRVTLKKSGRRELDRIARLIMTQYTNNAIRVEGYTDSDPIRKSKWKTNERLSSERAMAVSEYLIARGIDRDRIYSAAMGAANPKSSKEASRRVEIVILSR